MKILIASWDSGTEIEVCGHQLIPDIWDQDYRLKESIEEGG